MITFGSPRKDVLAAYLANARWEREEGGITIDSVDIATDRVSQNMINGAVAYLREDETVMSIEFKSVDGFATIGRTDMVLIGKAVAAHVQACFATERSILADIESGIVTTTAEIEAALDAVFL